MEEKQVQGIQNFDDAPFVSNHQNVTLQPDKILLDFKNIFPQFDPANNETLIINHRLILLDPWVAKSFAEILNKGISEYESGFEKIEKPKSIAKAESQMKDKKKMPSMQSYMG